MRFGLFKVVASLLLLTAAACGIEPPSGRIACTVHADCPSGFFCNELAAGHKRCSRQPTAADAGMLDAGLDAAMFDAGPGDTGVAADSGGQVADTSTPTAPDATPPAPDAGPTDPPLGENELPELIRRPLPECGKEPDAASAYFVSAGVGQDVANCGGPQGPCRSLSKALQRAVDDGVSFLYLDNTDVFTESEPISLPGNVVIAGGFSNVNGRWTRLCDGARGRTRLESSGNPVVVAEFAGVAKIASLTLASRVAAASETMIGLLARGAETKLWLDDVFVLAADGGDGTAGAPGASGAVLDASCAASDGADGESVGARGVDAPAGSFGPDGYVTSNGGPGADGAVGHAGALGAEVTCATCEVSCCSGGAVSCGEQGSPGCGGAAGGGGGGGAGGGSSVALFAWDAQVFSSGGGLQAGSGGDGADGGAAGSGIPGAAGALGASGAACDSCFEIVEFGGCIHVEVRIGAGTQGGTGGSGRDGGPGGAGAGGYAYAVYRGGAAKLTIADDTVLEHGAAGLGPAGAPGHAALIGP